VIGLPLTPGRVVAAVVALGVATAVVVTGCGDEPVGGGERAESALADPDLSDPVPDLDTEDPTRPKVVIRTAIGHIEIELRPDLAPRNVAQFLTLVDEGFYDGLTFHRAIPGFLVQGGDPHSRNDDPSDDGYGGLEDRRLPVEASELPFKRGMVGMARDYRRDGASSQFFILLGRAAHLDQRYSVIGRVVRGIDIADRLAAAPRDLRDRPLDPVSYTVVRMDPP
jgi:peptidyl-prolyl cis-trans isomerase B (cyclophilin B)